MPAFAEHFSDVGSSMGTKYRDAINYMSDNGIMMGFADGTFQPNTVLNRGMAVTILFRMSANENNTYSHNFTDVPAGSPYNNAIGWAKENGICYGTTETTFDPYSNVSKQQFITFLYRFAGYCGCSQATGSESLSNFLDVSSLSAYAQAPFKWAYNYGLFNGGDFSSSYLQPFDTVSRKNASLLGLNYRHNVQGIEFGRDNFRFINSTLSFVSGNSVYLMSEADWELFEAYYRQCYIGTKEETVDSDLNRIKYDSWGGSCFGMAMATALDYSGKIDFNGNFCNNASKMYEVPTLTDISNAKHKLTTAVQEAVTITVAESKINLLQNAQLLVPIADWKAKITPDTGLQELISGQAKGGIGVFCFSYYSSGQKVGHAIVVYGKPVQVNGKTRVNIYDNNSQVPGYIEITSTSNGLQGAVVTANRVTKQIQSCKYLNDLSTFSNYLDLDGDDNTVTTITATNMAILNNYTVLSVQAEGKTTITDSSGKTIVIDASGIGGTMNTYRENLIVFGEDTPALYQFAVPKSSSFTCVAETGRLVSFHATDNTGTVGASAAEQTDGELTSVTVNNMESCVVNGREIK